MLENDNFKKVWESIPEGNTDAGRAFMAFCKETGAFGTGHAVKQWQFSRTIRNIAAALLVPVLIAGAILVSRKNPSPSLCELSVPAGQNDSLTLPDGSRIWLNAGSSLVYPESFSGGVRQVFLSGEGYFSVAKDVKHPFILKAGNMSVEVLGTEFNVSSYRDMQSSSVALIEGSVRMRVEHDGMISESLMKPGEKICYDKATGRLTRDNVYAEASCAWRKGGFCFSNQPLSDIVAQFERVFSVRIEVVSEEMLKTCFSMAFVNGESLDSMLKAIADIGKMQFVRKNDTYIIK